MKKNVDKTRIISVGILAVLLFSTFLLFAINVYRKGQVAESAGILIIGIIVLVGLIFFIRKQYTDIKKGYPFHDERSKKVITQAGYKAFIISIWWILLIGWASSNGWVTFRDVSQATAAGILGMAIIFGLSWVYCNSKENVE